MRVAPADNGKGPRKIVVLHPAQKEIQELPEDVRDEFAQSIRLLSMGETPDNAKQLPGNDRLSRYRVCELRENYNSDTYRVAYTLTFKDCIYVLHAFQKKSNEGIATPRRVIDTIVARARSAQKDYEQRVQLEKRETHATPKQDHRRQRSR